MRLTIKNIDNIADRKLPKLDGYSISWGKETEHEYEFDIFFNYTVKMVLKVNRDSNYDGLEDKDNYTCTIQAGGMYKNHKWQAVLNRDEFKTKMGFLMVASEMVNKILLQQSNEQIYAGNTPITQSYNPPDGFKIW
jgi:hypothetical protein